MKPKSDYDLIRETYQETYQESSTSSLYGLEQLKVIGGYGNADAHNGIDVDAEIVISGTTYHTQFKIYLELERDEPAYGEPEDKAGELYVTSCALGTSRGSIRMDLNGPGEKPIDMTGDPRIEAFIERELCDQVDGTAENASEMHLDELRDRFNIEVKTD